MNKLYCSQSSQFLPIFTELEDLRSTCIANCVFNIFLSYTAFMLNIVTIYAIYKTSTMPKTLKTLLLSLACSDVAVGLFSQPLYTVFLINWLRLDNPGQHASNRWAYGRSSNLPSRLGSHKITVEMCQLNPLLPNQSNCFSRYLS